MELWLSGLQSPARGYYAVEVADELVKTASAPHALIQLFVGRVDRNLNLVDTRRGIQLINLRCKQLSISRKLEPGSRILLIYARNHCQMPRSIE